jgi:hypothetical protein
MSTFERSPGPTPRRLRARTLALAGLAGAALWAAAPAAAETQTYVPYRYVDPMTGLEAFRLLVPKGWRAEGSIAWSANPALPAQSRFRFYEPGGDAEMSLFPTQSFFWTDNPLYLSTNPPGTLRFGTPVARPVDLHAALTRMVIPGIRRGAASLEVVREQPVPELAELAKGPPAPGVRAWAEAGRIRMRYREGSRWMEEELFGVVSHFVTPQPGSMLSGPHSIDYWYVDYVFSFRAGKGRLDARKRTFETMIHSLRANPRWVAKVVNTKELLAQQYIRGIKAVGRMGDTVARAGSEMRGEQMRDWERRQEAQDRLARSFSDNIRGVDRFYDPHAEKEVELPSGYGMAWANDRGEYIVTSDPNLNPNVGSNLHWEPMTPAK